MTKSYFNLADKLPPNLHYRAKARLNSILIKQSQIIAAHEKRHKIFHTVEIYKFQH